MDLTRSPIKLQYILYFILIAQILSLDCCKNKRQIFKKHTKELICCVRGKEQHLSGNLKLIS